MSDVLPLFAPTARITDPDTSQAAATTASVHAGTHRALALDSLRGAPDGLTDFELADDTGIAQTSIGVRRKELVTLGLVRATDRRRLSPSGSPAIVWEAVTA